MVLMVVVDIWLLGMVVLLDVSELFGKKEWIDG